MTMYQSVSNLALYWLWYDMASGARSAAGVEQLNMRYSVLSKCIYFGVRFWTTEFPMTENVSVWILGQTALCDSTLTHTVYSL